MQLRQAFKEHREMLVLGEATLTRLGLTEEASMPLFDDRHEITGAVVACDRALVVFSIGADRKLEGSVHPWHNVSSPELVTTTTERSETILMDFSLRFARPALQLGTPAFDLGTIEWQMDSRQAVIDLWLVCLKQAGARPDRLS
jgi:hypothetical protein